MCRFARCQWLVAVQPAPTHTRAFAREVLHKIGRHAVVARPDDLGGCGASKKPASEVGLEEERTPKGPRAGELAEEQAATNEGSAQPHHDGHQASVQSAVQTPLDDVSPVQDAVHGACSCAQDFAAGFQPEVGGEDVDESQIFSSSTVTTVAPV